MNYWDRDEFYDEWDLDFYHQMSRKQKHRIEEVGDHTWQQLVEKYGARILFAEIASIVSRLEHMLWLTNPQVSIDANSEKLLDLTVDLANYTSFLYKHVWYEVDRKLKEARDSESPESLNASNIVVPESREKESTSD